MNILVDLVFDICSTIELSVFFCLFLVECCLLSSNFHAVFVIYLKRCKALPRLSV